LEMENCGPTNIPKLMNVRQQVINRLKGHEVFISTNQLEDLISKYKDVFNGRYRAIDLLYAVLDNPADFEDFLEFIKTTTNETKSCEAEEHFTIIACFAKQCKCEKKGLGYSQALKTK
jgi:hypothetical protein